MRKREPFGTHLELKLPTSLLCMKISSGMGLTLGEKLKRPPLLTPIQLPTSLALARLAERPRKRIWDSVCAAM